MLEEEEPVFLIDEKNGYIRMEGVSLMEISHEFYIPVIDNVKSYVDSKPDAVRIYTRLEYFNTTSSKYIMDIFKLFIPLHKDGSEVTVYWYYDVDDENMHEAGVDYKAMVNIPFKLIPVER